MFNETLICGLKNVDIEDKDTVTFYLTKGHCADMPGAIKIAQLLVPKVKLIKTFSGKEVDTRYVRKGKDWKAYLPR
jgi:hypothetical protein